MIFVLVLLLSVFSHSQPSWRSSSPPAAGVGAEAPTPAAGGVPRVVYRSRVVRDTVRDTVSVVRFDTVRVVDTVRDTVRDTVSVFPVQYKYVVRYALTSLNVDSRNPEWLDNASHSEIIARDTATLRIGVETVRTLGVVVDQHGNRFPQQDIITTGFTISVRKDNAVIEYRGSNSLAVFSGGFDSSGFLIATGEITESNFLAGFFPFSLFFKAGKKRLIIEITREAYL